MSEGNQPCEINVANYHPLCTPPMYCTTLLTALMSLLHNEALLQFKHMKMSTTAYENVCKLHSLLQK